MSSSGSETNDNANLHERDVEKQKDSTKNGSSKESSTPPDSATFRDRIAHFTWPWFTTTMSTGSIAVILANTPNRFSGLQTIGKIFFVFDLVLFVAFTVAMSLRAFWYPKRFIKSLHHPVEGLFFGTYGVSVGLILNATQSYGVPACGPWLVTALRVCYWIYLALSLLAAVAQYYIFFQDERLSLPDAVPAWIFPIYPLLVIGPLAGNLIPSQPHQEAVDMWVSAVMLQGLAWMVAFMQYGTVMQRLMSSSLPAPGTRPGMYVGVGPAGYTSAALIQLGMQAREVFPGSALGVSSVPVGDILRIIGFATGIFVILLAFWFFCIGTIAVIAGVRQMTFTLNWWAFVFPNAGLTLAAIQVGKALSSQGINGVCSALTIMLVIMWLVTAFAHIRAVVQGKIAWPGKDEDKDMKGFRWGRASA